MSWRPKTTNKQKHSVRKSNDAIKTIQHITDKLQKWPKNFLQAPIRHLIKTILEKGLLKMESLRSFLMQAIFKTLYSLPFFLPFHTQQKLLENTLRRQFAQAQKSLSHCMK